MEKKKVIDALQDAEMVLVGIGEEFFADHWHGEDNRYGEVCREVAKEEMQWVMPYVQSYFTQECETLKDAYAAVESLLRNKNYFLLTVCMDGNVRNTKVRQDRIVELCGTHRLLQCGAACPGSVMPAEQEIYDNIKKCILGEKAWSELRMPVCAACGRPMEFNSLYAESYLEEGYAGDWQRYTAWLQGTLNKKLCVLELGAGMMFASVLRFRFEKIVALNQKAQLIRIHENLHQIPGDIAGRGCGIKQNAVEFMRSIW